MLGNQEACFLAFNCVRPNALHSLAELPPRAMGQRWHALHPRRGYLQGVCGARA